MFDLRPRKSKMNECKEHEPFYLMLLCEHLFRYSFRQLRSEKDEIRLQKEST